MPNSLSKFSNKSEENEKKNKKGEEILLSSLLEKSNTFFINSPKNGNNNKENNNEETSSNNHKEKGKAAKKNVQRKNKLLHLFLNYMSRSDRVYVLIALTSLLVSSASNLYFPSILGRAVDYSINYEKVNKIVKIKNALCYVFSVFGVGAFAGWLRVFCFDISTHHLQNRLRKQLFAKLIKQDVEVFEQQKTGELMTTLLQDVETSSKSVTQNTASLLRSLNSAVGGTVMLLLLSRKLTLISLSLVPFVGFCAMIYSKFVKKLKKKLNDQLSTSLGSASEKLSNFKTVRMFGQEEKEVENLSENLDKLYPAARSVASADGCFMGGLGFAINTSLLAVLFFGGLLVERGELSIGNLTSFALYSSMVGLGFSGLSQVWSDMVKSSVSTDRLFNILDKPDAAIDKGTTLTDVRGEISFEDVTFCYPSRPDHFVIKNVSFKIEPGKVVALAGASGGGKSTIADLLLKLYSPTRGNILLDGQKISEMNSTWLRQNVFSVVNQEPVLFSGTIAENIKYGVSTATEEEVIEAAKKANADDFIKKLPNGYQTIVSASYCNLSVGQKQRIAIARAILKNTPCLILDEATSALDGEAERIVQNALEHAMAGRSVLMAAHRPSALRFANHILVLDAGKIVEEGTYDDLMSKENGSLRKLVGRKNGA